MMRHVQDKGGNAAHISFGAGIHNMPQRNLHTPDFDFDERAMSLAVELLVRCVLETNAASLLTAGRILP
jgi:metal-dependent amidase/aminoacylase/carboxypeptidase family protein